MPETQQGNYFMRVPVQAIVGHSLIMHSTTTKATRDINKATDYTALCIGTRSHASFIVPQHKVVHGGPQPLQRAHL